MFRADWSTDLIDPFGCNAHGIAAPMPRTLRLEQPRPLLFGLIGGPVIAPTFDVEAGMGQGTETFGQLDEART
jgi:hypothetical protein